MKRIQLFEFEDFGWFPDWLRNCMTNLIIVLHKLLGASEPLAQLIAKILKKNNLKNIVDLGSGSGGVMPEVLKKLQKKDGLEDITLTMTDLYPNTSAIKKYNDPKQDTISYLESPVDATDIATAPQGLKTMMNCYHHMKPDQARKILVSATENKQPLLIYEMGENKIPLLIWWILLPLSLVILMIMVLFMTPFVRPLTWKQIIFTYLIPIIPIFYAWDGQASMPRIYSFKDMDELLEGLESETYKWQKGHLKNIKNQKSGTYVLGQPSN